MSEDICGCCDYTERYRVGRVRDAAHPSLPAWCPGCPPPPRTIQTQCCQLLTLSDPGTDQELLREPTQPPLLINHGPHCINDSGFFFFKCILSRYRPFRGPRAKVKDSRKVGDGMGRASTGGRGARRTGLSRRREQGGREAGEKGQGGGGGSAGGKDIEAGGCLAVSEIEAA